MVGPLDAQTDARSVSDPEATLLRLLGGNLQPFASPDSLDPLVVDDPTRLTAQQLGNLAVAVAAILDLNSWRWIFGGRLLISLAFLPFRVALR